MKYLLRDKQDRNEELLDFAREHPDLTQAEIGSEFNLSRSRVSRILKKMANKEGR